MLFFQLLGIIGSTATFLLEARENWPVYQGVTLYTFQIRQVSKGTFGTSRGIFA